MSGPAMAFAFLLRAGGSVADALGKVVEGLRRYRGFFLDKHDVDPGDPGERWANFTHLGFEFDVGSLESILGEEPDVPCPPLLVLSADSDLMMNDDGDPDPEFWKAWQNAIALIVAEVNPWCGAFTDTDSLHEFAVRGFPKEAVPGVKDMWLLEYLSSDLLKAKYPGSEEAIRAFATREMSHGFLAATLLLQGGQRMKLDMLLGA